LSGKRGIRLKNRIISLLIRISKRRIMDREESIHENK